MAKAWALLFFRVSMGWLMVIWGINKIINTGHSIAVSDNYYSGLLSLKALLPIAGVLQALLGALIVIGLARRWAYPIQLLLNGASLFVVLPSVIDPWGRLIEDTNIFFYPSLIIFAGAVLLMAFRDQDVLALDARRRTKKTAWMASRCEK
jgi:putative oxidoreductase